MSDIQTLATIGSGQVTVAQLRNRRALIQETMTSVMKADVHFGKVSGCGDKPTLLKAGAEVVLQLFGLVVQPPTIEIIDIPGPVYGHREYRASVTITNYDGKVVGSGVGSCSTMEKKYRYRSGPVEWTGRPVPREYWDTRENDPKKAQDMIGGQGFNVGKNPATGIYEIVRKGAPIENQDPADEWNTCLKMAKKRAIVDAALTTAGASDTFTQDIEDMESDDGKEHHEQKQEKRKESQAAQKLISAAQIKYIQTLANDLSEERAKEFIGRVSSFDGMGNRQWTGTQQQASAVIEEMKKLIGEQRGTR